MQATPSAPISAGKIAFQQGAIFGVILAVLQIVFGFIPLGGLGILINIVLWLVVTFVAGMLAAKRTGRVSTGTLAGLWAGLISGIILLVYGLIAALAINPKAFNDGVQTAAKNANIPYDTARSSAIIFLVVILVVSLLIQLGVGAGFGAIGGVVGKNQAPVQPPQPYQEQLYQSPSQQPPLS